MRSSLRAFEGVGRLRSPLGIDPSAGGGAIVPEAYAMIEDPSTYGTFVQRNPTPGDHRTVGVRLQVGVDIEVITLRLFVPAIKTDCPLTLWDINPSDVADATLVEEIRIPETLSGEWTEIFLTETHTFLAGSALGVFGHFPNAYHRINADSDYTDSEGVFTFWYGVDDFTGAEDTSYTSSINSLYWYGLTDVGYRLL